MEELIETELLHLFRQFHSGDIDDSGSSGKESRVDENNEPPATKAQRKGGHKKCGRLKRHHTSRRGHGVAHEGKNIRDSDAREENCDLDERKENEDCKPSDARHQSEGGYRKRSRRRRKWRCGSRGGHGAANSGENLRHGDEVVEDYDVDDRKEDEGDEPPDTRVQNEGGDRRRRKRRRRQRHGSHGGHGVAGSGESVRDSDDRKINSDVDERKWDVDCEPPSTKNMSEGPRKRRRRKRRRRAFHQGHDAASSGEDIRHNDDGKDKSNVDGRKQDENRRTLDARDPSKDIGRLMEEFRKVYNERGAHDFQSQVKYLAALADYYHQKGADNSDWVCLLKAHTLYNSTAARNTDDADKWSHKAYEVQKTYWGEKVQITYQQQKEIMNGVRRRLAEVRSTIQTKLSIIRENYATFSCDPDQLISEHNANLYSQFTDHVEAVSLYCTDSMVQVFRQIVREAVKVIGEPPCKFCAVAIGSIARGEATPYSDLEFLFLLEVKSSDTVKYFEALAMTVYFIIGNLQETKLRYMAIDELSGWFEDTSTNGLKIDGLQKHAGNIPTGNGSNEQHNHFICSVDELASRYEKVFANPDPKESLRGDLTAMLYSTISIYGEKKLLDSFRAKIQQLKPNPARQEASANMLKNDMEKFNFFPDLAMSQKRNLKSDIYRYPSMLLFDLKILHRLKQSSTKLLKKLQERGVLSISAFIYLHFAYFSALYMRLSTYLYHGSQKEDISILNPDPDFLPSPDSWHMDQTLFLHMMIHLIPLKSAVTSGTLEHVVVISEPVMKFSAAIVNYYSGNYQACINSLKDLQPDQLDPEIRFMIAYCFYELGSYDEAENSHLELIQVYQQSYSTDHPDLAYSYNALGLVYSQQGDFTRAEMLYLRSLEMRQRIYSNSDHLDIAASYNNLGGVYSEQGDYERAEMYHIKSLEMKLRLYNNADHPGIADSYNNLGAVYFDQCKFDTAARHYMKSLEMKLRLYGNSDHPNIAGLYNNLGNVYCNLGDYEAAKVCHTKSLKMNLRLYGESNHPSIASCYHNLGTMDRQQGDYESAVIYFKNSLEINIGLYSNSDHPHIAASYNNLGIMYRNQGDYKRAVKYSTKSLEIKLRLYNNSDHPDIAASYSNLGSVCFESGDYIKAEMFFMKLLDLRLRLCGDTDHPDIAGSYNNLGTVYRKQGDYIAAEMYHTKSLEMRQRLYSSSDHPDIAASYSNLGNVYLDKGDYVKAEMCFTQLLEMRLRLCNDEDHPDVVVSYNNLGHVYGSQGDYKRAESCFTKSLEVNQRLCFNSDHADITEIYNNLGNVYSDLKDYKTAEVYFTKALEMNQRLYCDSDHPNTADSYYNLGNLHCDQENSKKAEMYFMKCLEIRLRLHGNSDHSDIAQIYNDLGVVYSDQIKDYETAEMYYIKSLEMGLRLYKNSDHSHITSCYSNLGEVYCNRGDYKKAEMYHKKSLQMELRLYNNSDHPDISDSYKNLGIVHCNRRDFTKAEMYHTKSLEMRQRLYSGDHSDIADSYHHLALVFARQGQSKMASLYSCECSEMKKRLKSK